MDSATIKDEDNSDNVTTYIHNIATLTRNFEHGHLPAQNFYQLYSFSPTSYRGCHRKSFPARYPLGLATQQWRFRPKLRLVHKSLLTSLRLQRLGDWPLTALCVRAHLRLRRPFFGGQIRRSGKLFSKSEGPSSG